jgi:hypothetical protein
MPVKIFATYLFVRKMFAKYQMEENALFYMKEHMRTSRVLASAEVLSILIKVKVTVLCSFLREKRLSTAKGIALARFRVL